MVDLCINRILGMAPENIPELNSLVYRFLHCDRTARCGNRDRRSGHGFRRGNILIACNDILIIVYLYFHAEGKTVIGICSVNVFYLQTHFDRIADLVALSVQKRSCRITPDPVHVFGMLRISQRRAQRRNIAAVIVVEMSIGTDRNCALGIGLINDLGVVQVKTELNAVTRILGCCLRERHSPVAYHSGLRYRCNSGIGRFSARSGSPDNIRVINAYSEIKNRTVPYSTNLSSCLFPVFI